MTIDAYSSRPHYLAHIAPIWNALPDLLRGKFHVPQRLVKDAQRHGIATTQHPLRMNGTPTIVASYSDYRAAHHRPVIFVEHGAGQTYRDVPDHPAYSGGRGRERVILFICPSDTVATRNHLKYPRAVSVAVGCPRIDQFLPVIPHPRSSPPVVAFTFHAHYALVPETESSYRYFLPVLDLVRNAGYQVLAHGHPNLYRRLVPTYARRGLSHTADPDEVFRKADVLCVDNSSLGFEAAAVSIPIVWLSPPTYRRDVHHGLRFWNALVLGQHAESVEEVVPAIASALAPISPELQQTRDNYLDTVYAHRDGLSAQRAAEAIMQVTADRVPA